MIIHRGFVGIDISKRTLDVFEASSGAQRVANTAEAIDALVDGFARRGDFVLFEATGVYDRTLRRALQAADVPFSRVNPGRVRDFARAAGFLAKTDWIDARMLAAMAQALPRSADAKPEPACEQLASLSRRRDQLVAIRQQERTRRRECHDPEIAADLDRHIAFLDAAVAGLDKQIKISIAANAALAHGAELLRSVPGVGPVTATTLLALLPELGVASHKALAALVGVAPYNADSGLFRGKRKIRGGRKRVRDALYMAAVTAARSNSPFAAFYKRLRMAGKPPKLALIALARKILGVLNAILRDQVPFHA